MEKENIVTLVEAAQAGNSDAISELFAAYKNDVYSIAMRITKDRALSDDIVQETFVEVILKINDLKNPSSFPAWLKIMAHHQCTRHYKKKEIVHETVAIDNDEGWSVLDAAEETNASFIPDEALDQKEFKATILEMIDDLPDAQRAALHMFYFEEMPLKVIAKIQGVSVNTANTRLNRGRLAMKDSIEKYEKKHGVRLHSIAFFPFFKWLLKGSEESMSAKSAARVAQQISAETGVSITASSTAIAAEAASATVTSASTTVASGAGAAGVKAAATSIISKVLAGVVAVSVAVGGTALYLDGNQENKHGDVSVQTEQTNLSGSESEATVSTTTPTEATTKNLSDILDFSKTWSHVENWENNTFCTSYVFEENGSFYCTFGWYRSELATAYIGTYTFENDILSLTYRNDHESFVCDYRLDPETLVMEQLTEQGISNFQNEGDHYQLYVEEFSHAPEDVKRISGYYCTNPEIETLPTEQNGTTDGDQDTVNYCVIDPFEAIDYVCYVEDSNTFVICQADNYEKVYDNGWIIQNSNKRKDTDIYIMRSSDVERDYTYFRIAPESFDGSSVTVRLVMSSDKISSYTEQGVQFKQMEKKYSLVYGAYVTDASLLPSGDLMNAKGYEQGCRIFYWTINLDPTSEMVNLLEFVKEYDWSSATNTRGCSRYYYSNLIHLTNGEIITENDGTTIQNAVLFGYNRENEHFISIEEYIAEFQTRWQHYEEITP